MDTSTWIWIIVGAIVLIALIALLAKMAGKKKAERNRAQASELRERAATKADDVKKHEAHARETEAQAAAARAEADRKAAEAERLEAEARGRAQAAHEHRSEYDETRRRADELDPDADSSRHDAGDTRHHEQTTAAGGASTTGQPTAEQHTNPAYTETGTAHDTGHSTTDPDDPRYTDPNAPGGHRA